jgi:hypothetical protein
MGTNEVIYRLAQNEVGVLIQRHVISQDIFLPGNKHLCFQVVVSDHLEISSKLEQIIFTINQEVFQKLLHPPVSKDPIAVVEMQISGQKVLFKLEVDIFNSNRREKTK